MFRDNKAYTIIEITIVMLAVSFFVVAIVTGGALLERASVRKVIAEIAGFRAAVAAFKDQHEYLPGDMPNADDYWDPTGEYDTRSGNGNGDGFIDSARENAGDERYFELFYVWKHLQLAGMVGGTFSGTGDETILFGEESNTPVSSYSGSGGGRGGFNIFNITQNDAYGRPIRTHIIRFAALEEGELLLEAGAMKIDSSRSIDLKLDDGAADRGNVRGTCWLDGPEEDPLISYELSDGDPVVIEEPSTILCYLDFNLGVD